MDGPTVSLRIVLLLLVLGLPLCGLLAAVLGVVALVRINRSGGALRGRGLAIGAIVLGGLMLLATPVLLFGGVAAAKGRARAEHERSMDLQE